MRDSGLTPCLGVSVVAQSPSPRAGTTIYASGMLPNRHGWACPTTVRWKFADLSTCADFNSMMALLCGHGHEKGRAMKHRNSVLHGMLSHLPWKESDDLVAVHGADKWVRTLSTKCQFVALLIGQLSGFCGLRETVSGVNSQAARLYHWVPARLLARRLLTPTRNARA